MRAPRAPALLLGLSLVASGCAEEPPPDDASIDAARAPDDASLDDSFVPRDTGPPPEPGLLVDDEGGVLVLRGTNVEGASKTAADHLPRQHVADFVMLRETIGLDAIRLLVFWQAIEPSEGSYDEAYLAGVRAVAQEASDAGLFVVVDMHQDVFGEGFGFTGAPRWACDESLYASFTPPAGSWALAYGEPEVQACFDRLYADASTRAAYAAAWAALAHALRDVPGVLAYELINEPSPGSATPRTFERTLAPTFYEEVIDAIRSEDPRPYVLFAPASPSNVGLSSSILAPVRERVVYAPHLYSPSLELGGGYDGDTAAIARQLGVIVDDAAERALPFAITELGVQSGIPRGADYLRDLFDALDAARTSALQWEIRGGYDLVDGSGAPTELGLALARPYPRRTAGAPGSFSWDRATATFTFTWDEDALEASGDTVVAAPRASFPDGFDATLDDAGLLEVRETEVVVPRAGGRRRLTIVGRPAP